LRFEALDDVVDSGAGTLPLFVPGIILAYALIRFRA